MRAVISASGCDTPTGPVGSLWLTLVLLALLGICGYFGVVVQRYDNREGADGVRRAGFVMQLLGATAVVVVMVMNWLTRHGDCQPPARTAAVQTDLLLVGIVLYSAGLLLYKQRATWAAIAIVANVDVAAIVIVAATSSGSQRALGITAFGTHGVCCVVAAWWARRLRHAETRIRAKASEAGRTLVIGWLILLLLIMFGGSALHAGESDKQLVNLFLITAVSAVMGRGYTAYTEARHAAGNTDPDPDLMTCQLASGRMIAWLSAWGAVGAASAMRRAVTAGIARYRSWLIATHDPASVADDASHNAG